MEKTGKKVKNILQKSSIGVNKSCPTGCVICRECNNRISCLTTDVTYKITCNVCKKKVKPLIALYDGETTRSARTRALEHVDKLKKKDNESTLWNHEREYHEEGVVPDYKFEITGSYLKRPLHRQLMEAVRIEQTPVDIRMNSKNEWILPMSLGVRLERGATS